MSISKETTKKVNGLFHQAQDKMIRLYNRWQDEKDYEDIKDYAISLQPLFEKFGATFIKMNKKPFGFTCLIDGSEFRYSMKNSTYEVKEI